MVDCLFCKIINGDIPSKKVYEDESTYAFYDISPQAPKHVLVIPKMHVSNVLKAAQHDGLFDACLRACATVATIEGIDKSGFRIVSNVGEDACQTVHHLHFHVIGGKQLSGEMA